MFDQLANNVRRASYAVESGAAVLRPKITSWWDFEANLLDQARGDNFYAGAGVFESNATGTGNRLAQDSVPLSTATARGFNFYVQNSPLACFAFGARITVSKLAGCLRLLTVGNDSGVAVTGVISIGISAAGKWQVQLYNSSNGANITLVSVANAVVNTETHVGVDCQDNAAANAGFTLRLIVNGQQVAINTNAGYASMSQVNGAFVIGTREAGGYRPAVSEMFWAHAAIDDSGWTFLHNQGRKRFYSSIRAARYDTTYDAFLAALMLGKTGAIYKLNEGGTNAPDSNTSAPLGAGTLLGGAGYSRGVTVPIGFGGGPSLYCNGTGGRMLTPSIPFSSYGAGSGSMGAWFYQTAKGESQDCYINASAAGQPHTGRRALIQDTTAATLRSHYNDFSGNTMASETSVWDSRVNRWCMLAYIGDGYASHFPSINGIVCASPGYYSDTGTEYVGTFGSYYGGSSGVQCYMSRAFVRASGTFAMQDLAKLYDLATDGDSAPTQQASPLSFLCANDEYSGAVNALTITSGGKAPALRGDSKISATSVSGHVLAGRVGDNNLYIYRWTADTSYALQTITGTRPGTSAFSIFGTVITDDGQWVVVGGHDTATVYIYQYNGTGYTCIQALAYGDYVRAVCFSPNQTRIIVSSNAAVRRYDFNKTTGALTSPLAFPKSSNHTSADWVGNYILISAGRGFVVRASDMAFVCNAPANCNGEAWWSADGKYVYITNDANQLQVLSFNGSTLTAGAAYPLSGSAANVIITKARDYIAVQNGAPYIVDLFQVNGATLTAVTHSIVPVQGTPLFTGIP